MEVIVVNRTISDSEEKQILQLLKKKNTIELFASAELPASLQVYSKGSAELTADDKRVINFKIFNKIIEFGEARIDNQAITDMLTYEKVSFWHYHKFRIYFTVRNLFYEIELINQLNSKYTNIYYFGENELLKIYPFDFKRIHIHIRPTDKSGFSIKSALGFLVFFIIRALLGFMQLSKLKNRKYIVIDHTIKQVCLNLKTLQPEPGNYNLQYLFEKLDNRFIILSDTEIPKFTAKSDFVFDKSRLKSGKNIFFGEWVLFRGLISGKIRKDLKNTSELILSNYNQIESEISDPAYKLILHCLRSIHASGKLFLFKYLAYKKFFTKYNLTSVTSIDENSARIKSILDAAKAKNIITVGIQHGTIHELHPAYIFSKEDHLRNIVPDYTMLWGKYWKQFLIEKGNYKPESLEITGQIRTDIIPKLTNVNAQDYLNISGGTKIITFASQPQRDPKLREQAAFDVFSSIRDMKNVVLVVKLHPAEKNDFDFYHNIAQKAGCSNYKILLLIDLYLLISISDIMITCFSTVGAETVYFNKPLVILDHLKQDIQGYFREGIAIQATNVAELKDYLVKILSGEINYNKTAYINYIEKYAHKIDGKVAERIIDFIRNL